MWLCVGSLCVFSCITLVVLVVVVLVVLAVVVVVAAVVVVWSLFVCCWLLVVAVFHENQRASRYKFYTFRLIDIVFYSW